MNATATTTTRDARTIAAKVISWMFVAITAYFSASHIFGLGHNNGLTMAEAIALVPMIDGFGVLGRILRSMDTPTARRFGTWMTVIACTVSLAANFFHGQNLAQRLFGLVTVFGFIAAEAAVHVVKKATAEKNAAPTAPVITPADVQAAVSAAVAAAVADEAARTADAIAAALAKAEKNRLARERRAARKIEADAPTSPAPFAAPAGLVVPTVAEMRALVNAR